MKEGEAITHLTTQPPEQRHRCLMCRQLALDGSDSDDSDGDGNAPADGTSASDGLRFLDGLIKKYQNRPEGEALLPDGTVLDWESITYPHFWRRFDVQTYSSISAATV
eukprot:7376353-Prymnesium_polylepis.1